MAAGRKDSDATSQQQQTRAGALPAAAIVSGLLLPASAECPVQLHETLVLGAARLRQSEFRGKERPLAIENFEVSRGPALVTHGGEADGFLQVSNGILLANTDLMEFLIANERIGHVAEGALNGLPVRDQDLLVLRFG